MWLDTKGVRVAEPPEALRKVVQSTVLKLDGLSKSAGQCTDIIPPLVGRCMLTLGMSSLPQDCFQLLKLYSDKLMSDFA
jgi:hypothetical protein